MIEWFDMSSPYPEIKVWGAIELPFQYCMSYDESDFKFYVSAKTYPNAGKRTDLGVYYSRSDAELACANHWWNHYR